MQDESATDAEMEFKGILGALTKKNSETMIEKRFSGISALSSETNPQQILEASSPPALLTKLELDPIPEESHNLLLQSQPRKDSDDFK